MGYEVLHDFNQLLQDNVNISLKEHLPSSSNSLISHHSWQSCTSKQVTQNLHLQQCPQTSPQSAYMRVPYGTLHTKILHSPPVSKHLSYYFKPLLINRRASATRDSEKLVLLFSFFEDLLYIVTENIGRVGSSPAPYPA
jgi:hypothetical protein